jgi:hypothetical protein
MIAMPYRLLAACSLVALTVTPALADESRSLAGSRLELRMGCSAHVVIQPQPDLSGKVQVEARGGAAGALHFAEGDTAAIDYRPECDTDAETLELEIHVPPGMPIDIREAIAGDYEIGAVGGPLKMRVTGAAELRAETLSSLDLDSAGAAEIQIERLDGPGLVGLHGGGDLTISGGTMPKLKLETHGAGLIQVDSGEIALLDISMAGAGNAEIHANVKDASLEIIGIGLIAIDKVTGQVRRSIVGLGSIDIDS